MQATLWFYIIVGLLTILPLILFNIKRVFVRKKPQPLKINWVRGVVILLLCGVIGTFLVCAYDATMHRRYEIALERVATEHSEVLLGKKSEEDFKNFLRENGTKNIEKSLENIDLGEMAKADTIEFQLGNQCTPKYWTEWDGMVNYTALVNNLSAMDLEGIYGENTALLLKAEIDGALADSIPDEEILKRHASLTQILAFSYNAFETYAGTMNLEEYVKKTASAFEKVLKNELSDSASEEEIAQQHRELIAAYAGLQKKSDGNSSKKSDEVPAVYIWQGTDVITVTDMQANPVYLMYRLKYDTDDYRYYAMRLVNTEDGWRYDWFGTPNERQQKDIKMPTAKNGKWYSVSR